MIFQQLLLTSILLSILGMPMSAAFGAPTQPPITISLDGPRGDGKTDDTFALQHALDTQKIVTLGPGTYRITRPLRLSSGYGLIGPGKILVDFDSATMDDANAALRGAGRDIRVEGITVEKRFRDGSYGMGILIASGSENVVVRNVEIRGYSARYGIHIVESESFEITGCYIHDFIMDTTADMILDSPAGIRITRSQNGIISNNRIQRIEVGAQGYVSISPVRPAYGKQLYQSDCITVMQCRRITLVGNVLDTSGEGIDLLLSQDCTVSANSIRNIWFQGIKMLGVRYSAVTGNVLRDCKQGIGLAEHVTEKTECVGNTVTGNTILDSGSPGTFRVPAAERISPLSAFGIDLDGNCHDNTIAHNTILDTQAKKTMTLPIHGGEKLRNIIEGNSLGN